MVGFVINVYQDWHLAEPLCHQIRVLYPTSPIAVICDGESPDDCAEFCHDNDIQHHCGDRLKMREHGGAWLKRMLTIAQDLNEPYVVKLDPDSWLWRPFREPPPCDLSGTVRFDHQLMIPFVSGGGCCIRKNAIQRILNSGYLDDARYTQHHFTYIPRRHGERQILADAILGHVSQRIGLTIGVWNDVKIHFNSPPPLNTDWTWAITHPHFEGNPMLLSAAESAALRASWIQGKTSVAELRWLYENAQGVGVEIGSFCGRSAVAIGQKLKDTNGWLTCIDPWENSPDQQVNRIECGFLLFLDNIQGLPISFARQTSEAMHSRFEDKSLDFVFIDGDHSYESVRNDIINWMPKIKSGGLLCGHDFSSNFMGVKTAVTSLLGMVNTFETLWYAPI